MNISTLKHMLIGLTLAAVGSAATVTVSQAAMDNDVPLIEGLIASVDYELNLLVVGDVTYSYRPQTEIFVLGRGKTLESSLQEGLTVRLFIETQNEGVNSPDIRLNRIIILPPPAPQQDN